VAGNIGCLVQLRTHLQALGRALPLYHTMQVIDRAYRTSW
jgi:glycolate oxidase iron-sulfur subunit